MASFLFYLVIILAALGTGFMIQAVWQTNRDFRAVEKATCISCGAAFGLVAAKKAQTDFEEAVNRVLDENPGWFARPKREWSVQCPACGMRHKYLLDGQEISAEKVDGQGL